MKVKLFIVQNINVSYNHSNAKHLKKMYTIRCNLLIWSKQEESS